MHVFSDVSEVLSYKTLSGLYSSFQPCKCHLLSRGWLFSRTKRIAARFSSKYALATRYPDVMWPPRIVHAHHDGTNPSPSEIRNKFFFFWHLVFPSFFSALFLSLFSLLPIFSSPRVGSFSPRAHTFGDPLTTSPIPSVELTFPALYQSV